MSRRFIENEEIDAALLDRTAWKEVLVGSLQDPKKELFLNRKRAVDMYIDGEIEVNEIVKQTNISKQTILRLIKRCLSSDQNGEMLGYRALIPYKRIKNYTRIQNINGFSTDGKGIPLNGAFTTLLSKYPKIKEMIENYYLNKKNKDPREPVIRVKYLHRKFVSMCKSEGISAKDAQYPFNTKDLARRSLYRYVKSLEFEYANRSIKRYGGEAEMLLNNTGIGEDEQINIRPFRRVEFDGHKIDAIFAIEYETVEGDIICDVINRIWILTIIDTATRVILGYHICLNSEYSAFDVLKCIRSAVLPWEPKELTIDDLKYSTSGGFPSKVIPLTQFAVWDEIAFDNAKANLALKVKDKLKKVIGCSVNTGPVATPTRRPIIEKFFDLLEENGFHRLPNTTGSNIQDPRRLNPEKAAVEFKITVEEIKEIIEVLVANRNGTPQHGTNYMTPLEVMEQRIVLKKMEPRILPEELREEVKNLTITFQVTVRGDFKKGRRPFVHFMGVQYRSDLLANSWHLVRKRISIVVNTEDLRYIKAYLENGEEIGALRAKGKWAVHPHTIEVRKQINKLKNKRLIHFTSEDDPIDIYLTYLKNKAKSSKQARRELSKIGELNQLISQEEIAVVEGKSSGTDNEAKVNHEEKNLQPSQFDLTENIKEFKSHQNRRTFNF